MPQILTMTVGWPVLWVGHWIVGAAVAVLPDGVHRAAGMTGTIDRD
mgnify:CR=1 FL=1